MCPLLGEPGAPLGEPGAPLGEPGASATGGGTPSGPTSALGPLCLFPVENATVGQTAFSTRKGLDSSHNDLRWLGKRWPMSSHLIHSWIFPSMSADAAPAPSFHPIPPADVRASAVPTPDWLSHGDIEEEWFTHAWPVLREIVGRDVGEPHPFRRFRGSRSRPAAAPRCRSASRRTAG